MGTLKVTNLEADVITGINTTTAPSFPHTPDLDAGSLMSGTIPDGRFPAVLPAVSGEQLTNLPSQGATGPTGLTGATGSTGPTGLNRSNRCYRG